MVELTSPGRESPINTSKLQNCIIIVATGEFLLQKNRHQSEFSTCVLVWFYVLYLLWECPLSVS